LFHEQYNLIEISNGTRQVGLPHESTYAQSNRLENGHGWSDPATNYAYAKSTPKILPQSMAQLTHPQILSRHHRGCHLALPEQSCCA
jgi:hypothetical protein